MMPSPDIFPVPLIHISETNSTNNYLQSLCSKQKVEELTVVVADFQTSGRGQRGNSWESDSGKNLLFSIVIFPEFLEARRQFLINYNKIGYAIRCSSVFQIDRTLFL